MGLWQKISSWWNRDALEEAEEESHMTQAERDVAEEDYEARKDDVEVEAGGEFGTVPPGMADFERDSEPPQRY